MFKYILGIVTILVVIWMWAVPVSGENTDINIDIGINELFDEYEAGKLNKYILGEPRPTPYGMLVVLRSKQNLTSHDHFPWEWHSHTLRFWYDNDGLSITGLNRRHYQEYLSPDSRGYDEWNIILWGTHMEWDREYTQVMERDLIMVPIYPQDFISDTYHNPTREQATLIATEEIMWWKTLVEKLGE